MGWKMEEICFMISKSAILQQIYATAYGKINTDQVLSAAV